MIRKTLLNEKTIAIHTGTSVMEFYSAEERLGLTSEYSMVSGNLYPSGRERVSVPKITKRNHQL